METKNRKFKPFKNLTYEEKRNFILYITCIEDEQITKLIDTMLMLKQYKVLSPDISEIQIIALEILTQQETDETVEELYNDYIEEKEECLKVYNSLLDLKSRIKNSSLAYEFNDIIDSIETHHFDGIMENYLI